jgi:hypothetical protein
MKRIDRIKIVGLIIITAITVNSCKKGKDGEPGKDGISSVTSHTFSVSNWTDNATYWYTHLSTPELTSDNINSTSVQVYFSTVANNWQAMPFTYVGSTDHFMNYISAISLIEVRWEYNGAGSGSSPVTIYGAASMFKVVIIPPAIIKQHPNVDLNNYNEVKETFNLKD